MLVVFAHFLFKERHTVMLLAYFYSPGGEGILQGVQIKGVQITGVGHVSIKVLDRAFCLSLCHMEENQPEPKKKLDISSKRAFQFGEKIWNVV
jgi:hypothetical protein